MTQIIEFTKHFDNYLVYHFEFECNENSAIGKYAGNCSINKFMSLNDWHQILNALHEPVEYYIQNPLRKPTAIIRQIDCANFQLQISWMDLDATFYSKLLRSIDFQLVFPFVIHIKIFQRSNVDKFVSSVTVATTTATGSETKDKAVVTPAKKPIKKIKLAESIEMPKENIDKSTTPTSITINGVKNTIRLRDCCVRLPLLQFDENGEVIQKDIVRNKRKFSQINENIIHSVENSPHEFVQPNDFKCSSSSTPFVVNLQKEFKSIKSDVRGTFDKSKHKAVKRLTNRLTTTPRKSSSQFNFPRLRLLKAPDSVKRLKSMQKNTGKNTAKPKTGKGKALSKRLKSKPSSIANESQLFETEAQPKKVKKASESKKDKKKWSPIAKIVTVEERNLKALSDDELWKSFDEHHEFISDMFHNYLKQTDAKVRRAGDYNHFDMISLFTTDQFSIMLDILFDKFVKIGEFGEICYDSLFLELLIPEWALKIFMKRHGLDRESAIEHICANKSNNNASYEGYTSIVTIKLDETMNSSTKH